MDMVFIYFNFQQITGYRNKYRTMYINVYQKINNNKKKFCSKSIDLIYISLKRIQHRLGVCQKITELYVQVSSTPNVKSRAFPCIYRYHDIYLSEPNMLETCTGMEYVIGYISELRKKCT